MIWEKAKFGSLYKIDSRNGLTKPSKVRGEGYKMINMGELFSYDRIYDIPMELVPLKDSEKINAKVEAGDLLFARQSLVLEGAGKCSIVMETSDLTVFESHIIRVRLKSEENPLFYYYYFKSPLSPVSTIVSQCAQAGIRGSDLSNLEVICPSRDIQDKTVDILSAYDDLIENNQKQIKLLEEAAQRLYKEWFINLRFPGYENVEIVDGVPEGWNINRADYYFKITIGKTPSRAEKQWFTNSGEGTPWISISDMGETGAFAFYSKEDLTADAIVRHNMKVVPKGSVLVSFKLTVGRVAITGDDMCTNEAIAHFYIDNDLDRAYTYCYLKNFEYDSLGNTSSISKAINSKIIKSMPFIMPTRDILERFSMIVQPILDQIEFKQITIFRLTEARDRLLPKLMCGEIEV